MSTIMSCKKKSRGANYSREEKVLLLRVVNCYLRIVGNKKINAATIREKDRAWDAICVDYNAKCENYRTKASLKTCYENLKKVLKKEEDHNIQINAPRVGGVTQDYNNTPASPQSGTDPLIVPRMDIREYVTMEDGTTIPENVVRFGETEDWPPCNDETGEHSSPLEEKCIVTFLPTIPSNDSDRSGFSPSKSPPQRPLTLKSFGSLAEVKLEMLKEDAEQKRRRDDEDYRTKKRVEREEAEVRLQILKTELLIKKEILKQEIEKTNSIRKCF